jgi:putative ABC transport system permease protein
LLPTTVSQAKLEQLRKWLPADLILAPIDNQQNGAELTQSFHLNLFAMALLMFAVCLFIVMNACNLLMYKRFAMLKIMRQLGVGRLHILFTHAFEFVIFATVISAIGVALGSEIAMLIAPTIRGIIEGLYRVQVGFIDTAWLVLYAKVLAISLIGIAVALLVPFRQLNQTMAHTHSHSEQSHIRGWIGSAMLALSAVAVLIFSFSETLSILLVGAAAMILAGSCLLVILFPRILALCYRLVPSRLTLLRLSLAQSLALSQKTKIACCAFFIAVTSNLGMNLMVDSFRASTEGWLSQRLVAEHYLYSDNPIANAKLADLAAKHKVTLQPRFEQQMNVLGQNAQLFSYPTEELFKRAMVFEQKDADAWEAFEDGKGVFINQQLSIRNRLSVNDTLDIESPLTKQTRSFKIKGIIYDYGNPLGQVLMPPSQFSQDFTRASIFAVSGDASAIKSFAASLGGIGIKADSQFFPSADILSSSMQVFDNTFIITDGLNLVTLLVAAISLACTLITLIDQGRPQNMLLRAIGISAWQGRGLLLSQYMLLCLVALIAATPFGLLLSYVLINQINYYAFNWSYPLVIDLWKIIELYGISFSVVILVISIPIIAIRKQSLAQELKCLD